MSIDMHAAQTKFTMIIRVGGTFFVVFGLLVFFDVAGLASMISLSHGGLDKIVGGLLLSLGIIEFFVFPKFFPLLFK